jgi:hypothetical protein
MLAATLIVLGFIVYTYLGYPVAIGILARVAPRRPSGEPPDRAEPRSVSICLPVSNGAGQLQPKLESLLAQAYPADRLEIMSCCCSTTSVSRSRRTQSGTSRPRSRIPPLAARRGRSS